MSKDVNLRFLVFNPNFITAFVVLVCLMCNVGVSVAQQKFILESEDLYLEWIKTDEGYKLSQLSSKNKGKLKRFGTANGLSTYLFSAQKPDTDIIRKDLLDFPGTEYKYIIEKWKDGLRPVALNKAGTAVSFYPSQGKAIDKHTIEFSNENDQSVVVSTWNIDPVFNYDINVKIKLKVKIPGYYSIQTPTISTLKRTEMTWATVPGYFQGSQFQSDLILSYAYGNGVPDIPVVLRERTASTLSPLVSSSNGLTMAVVADPKTGRNPWLKDKITQKDWQLGLSVLNRSGELVPTLYHPVLGEPGSYLNVGDEVIFNFRYTLKNADWYDVYKHAVYDIYKFRDQLGLRKPKVSLTNRVLNMVEYLKDDSLSKWIVKEHNGLKIGAQAYYGGVVGSDRDAMKNSDYGAMWMLANMTGEPVFINNRLPLARNFKLAQQQTKEGFFKGAASGQYYLYKSDKFVEEWGDYVEPIGLTYYTLIDLGNILLFEPKDMLLRERLRLGADRLLSWQEPGGNWEVAYDKASEKQIFKDLLDLRPTYYGLLVAYRILGDQKYLDAAITGANWLIKNSLDKGSFLGVCGDTRFVADFATAQMAQSFLDLYEITKNKGYYEAAVKTAQIYTTSIYTHPLATTAIKTVGKKTLEDWQISQVGLGFEHGGLLGSANQHGPILLASHAGMFVRMTQLTGDPLFADMARSAAWGREAFVESKSSVASYYWNTMDGGPGSYPHHAWWQAGWIIDYLIAEIRLRSNDGITFPSGFMAPKVGPHKSFGFAPGQVFGKKVNLFYPQKRLDIQNPQIDFVAARTNDKRETYLIFLNNSQSPQQFEVETDWIKSNIPGFSKKSKITILNESGKEQLQQMQGVLLPVKIPKTGLQILKISQ